MIDQPYPSDLEAKGWSLDLDYERIEQSDTWAIASPEQRPWLLMLWMIAWRQVPVASLPDDDRLIAARIGMPQQQFTAWRDVLLCGWELANDGRLYHKTLTEHALRMADKRNKDRQRVALFRDKSRLVATCNALHVHDSTVSSTPTPTPTPTPKELESPKGDLSPEAEELASEDDKAGVPRCPVQKIVALYHEHLPELAPVKELPEQSVKMLRSRWRSDPKRQTLDWWAKFFVYVKGCPFLVGEKTDFTADLLWLVRPTNFAKVVNGNYEQR